MVMALSECVMPNLHQCAAGLQLSLDCIIYILCMCQQCVPYLICMSSDPDVNIRLKADQQLLEIDKKYAGFIQVGVYFKQVTVIQFIRCIRYNCA